ncbi:MAG TPA: hypothetical protein VMG38_09405 [Trebonia sp.]|nr:hypothetical protein [Trebonia sp.]
MAGTEASAGAAGQAEAFPGWAGDGAVELHVHEDALILIADEWTRRLGFSFVNRATVDGSAAEVALTGGDSVVITRLGRRAGELAALVEERLRESRGRTAAFLGSLLPGLDAMAAQAVATLLRDGVAVPTHSLDAIHPEVTATLLRVATRPSRFPAVAALAQHTDVAIGFKQAISVRVAARGASPARPGYGGPFGGGPDGGLSPFWAYQALGHGINWDAIPAGASRPILPRADPHRGSLTPPQEDLAALTSSGAEPAVLAFALFASSRGRVAYDVLNLPAPTTYVYEASGDARSVINRALDDTGFQAAAVPAAAAGTDAAALLLMRSLLAQVPRDRDWQRQLAGLL